MLRERRYLVAGLACVLVAAISLLGPHQPTYDPWAWLLWGREIVHGDLNTVGGPSWKPLPVLFTAPFSVFGDAAPQLWLVVARTGFLLGVLGAFRLASSLAGRVAGVLAGAGVVLVDRFMALSVRGDSEGVLAALAMWAIVLHREGRRRAAVLAALAACLVRPEVWPFAGLYGLWVLLRAVEPARRARVAALLALGGLIVLAAWFVPEQVGSGSLLRGASRAREPVPDSPAQSSFPFLAVFTNSAGSVAIALYAGGFAGVALAARAWRRARDAQAGVVLLLAAAATAYMVIVGVLAQSGFTGNQRYVLLPASLVCVVGGVGLVWGLRALAGAGRPAVVGAAVLGAIALTVWPVVRTVRELERTQRETTLTDRLGEIVDRAGGPGAIKRCGKVFTDNFQTQAVLWKLHLTGDAVGIHPVAPGTILAPAGTRAARAPGFSLRARHGGWVLRSTCR